MLAVLLAVEDPELDRDAAARSACLSPGEELILGELGVDEVCVEDEEYVGCDEIGLDDDSEELVMDEADCELL